MKRTREVREGGTGMEGTAAREAVVDRRHARHDRQTQGDRQFTNTDKSQEKDTR